MAGINPRLVNRLRHAQHPLPVADLADLYPEATRFELEIGLLARHRLVADTDAGLVWQGS